MSEPTLKPTPQKQIPKPSIVEKDEDVFDDDDRITVSNNVITVFIGKATSSAIIAYIIKYIIWYFYAIQLSGDAMFFITFLLGTVFNINDVVLRIKIKENERFKNSIILMKKGFTFESAQTAIRRTSAEVKTMFLNAIQKAKIKANLEKKTKEVKK